jgi:hypothetical protein
VKRRRWWIRLRAPVLENRSPDLSGRRKKPEGFLSGGRGRE